MTKPPKDQAAQHIVADVLSHIPGLAWRAMFGGYGLYHDGRIFGIIADQQLWFKVDDSTRVTYQAMGSRPFTYIGGSGKPHEMSYWLVPEGIWDDKAKILALATQSANLHQNK